MRSASTISRRLKAFERVQALFLPLLMAALTTDAQVLATLKITLEQPAAGLQVPASIQLDPVTHLADSQLTLVAVVGNKKTAVPFQVESGRQRMLTWLVNDKVKNQVFELHKSNSRPASAQAMVTTRKDGALTLSVGKQNLLRYHYEPVPPPAGIDPVFTRSAFIHPLWSPKGQELTRIQAPDHYHHYGLWNPWTHVLFEGDTVDFWNLKAKQGTVRFGDFVSTTSGNVYGEFQAIHEHIVFQKEQEKVAIRELQTVRVYAPAQDEDYYILDITVQLNCPESPVRLLEYRYGGIGWRATEQWTKENSRVLTSEGKTRKEADGSKARWCIVEGTVDDTSAGAVMMSYPVNYNHPEPLRIWPENANGNRGDMFANFSPTKDMDWPLEPGRNYVLRYRFIVFNGQFSASRAEAGWRYFAQPPAVTVIRNTKVK